VRDRKFRLVDVCLATSAAPIYLPLADDLTGLYNRRGFLTHAGLYIQSARSSGRPFLLFYADVDGPKQINDAYGHEEGSRVINEVADVLRETFRDSGIIARLGGDEFTILAVDAAPDGEESIRARLRENLRSQNERRRAGYDLSLSMGTVRADPNGDETVEELIHRADRAMYEHKRGR